MNRLEYAHYKCDEEQLQNFHTANGLSYDTLDELHDGLNHLD